MISSEASIIHCQTFPDIDSLLQVEYLRSVKQFSEFTTRFNQDFYEVPGPSGQGWRVDRHLAILMLFYDDDPRFDKNSAEYSPHYIDRVMRFIHDVTENGLVIDKHSDQVRAIARMQISYNGSRDTVKVFLVQEIEDPQLVRWVISGIEGASLQIPDRDTSQRRFLSPVSHELGFMDLTNAMNEPEKMINYTNRNFEYDMLSVFLHSLATGIIEFGQILSVDWEVFINDRYTLRIGERLLRSKHYGIVIYDLLVNDKS